MICSWSGAQGQHRPGQEHPEEAQGGHPWGHRRQFCSNLLEKRWDFDFKELIFLGQFWKSRRKGEQNDTKEIKIGVLVFMLWIKLINNMAAVSLFIVLIIYYFGQIWFFFNDYAR